MHCLACNLTTRYRFLELVCPRCGVEAAIDEVIPPRGGAKRVRAVRASSVATTSSARRVKTDADTDRATGGGFVLGSAWLLSGFAGSGKSTGALRWSRKISRATSRPILYGSAEMAPDLVRAMAARLELDLDQLWILATEDLHALCVEAVELRPCAVVLDSVARFCVAGGDPGTPTAMVGTVQASIHLARQIDAVAFAIAHATTEGTVKGPTDLEHDVDVAAWVRDDGIAEITKNRWGATPAEIIARRQ